jgi:hypothetical protein
MTVPAVPVQFHPGDDHGALDGVGVAVVSDAQQGRAGKHNVGRDSAEPC